MNAAERGDELATIVHDEIITEVSSETDRQIMTSRVVRRLIKEGLYVPPKTPATAKVPPMSESQAKAFQLQLMPFGQHKGEPIFDVPLSYLCHLTEPSEFMEELKRYLDNPEIQRKIES